MDFMWDDSWAGARAPGAHAGEGARAPTLTARTLGPDNALAFPGSL